MSREDRPLDDRPQKPLYLFGIRLGQQMDEQAKVRADEAVAAHEQQHHSPLSSLEWEQLGAVLKRELVHDLVPGIAAEINRVMAAHLERDHSSAKRPRRTRREIAPAREIDATLERALRGFGEAESEAAG